MHVFERDCLVGGKNDCCPSSTSCKKGRANLILDDERGAIKFARGESWHNWVNNRCGGWWDGGIEGEGRRGGGSWTAGGRRKDDRMIGRIYNCFFETPKNTTCTFTRYL